MRLLAAIDLASVRPLQGHLSIDPQFRPDAAKASFVAMRVLSETRGYADAESLHAAGLANLLLGRNQEAAQLLKRSARVHPDSRVFSDIAAALITLATDDDQPRHLPDALVAADRALELDSRSHAAMFNRALALEKMGLRGYAQQAWEAYTEADSDSSWVIEARWRSRNHAPEADDFYVVMGRLQRLTGTAYREEIIRLVRQEPERLRRWIEEPILSKWAEAEDSGNTGEARRSLAFARVVGEALLSFNGDAFVADGVAAIDNATRSQRRILIRGHLAYREGQVALAALRQEPRKAERRLADAAHSFDDGRSPMADVARGLVASALLAQGRRAEVATLLSTLRRSNTATRSPSFRANIDWVLGLSNFADGDVSGAIAAHSRSAAAFAALGERSSAARVRLSLADVYAWSGERDEAWRLRAASFPLLSDAELGTTIVTAADNETETGHASSAITLARLVSQNGPMSEHGQAQCVLASAYAATGDNSKALRAIDQGSQAPGFYWEWCGLLVKAERFAKENPKIALSYVEKFISYTPNIQALPRLHILRARALRRSDRISEAAAVLEDSITAAERQHSVLPDEDLRAKFLDSRGTLFRELVELHVNAGDIQRALEATDRWRARELLANGVFHDGLLPERRPGATDLVADGVALIEYVVLADRLVIFVVTQEGIAMHTAPTTSESLHHDIARFESAVRDRQSPREVRKSAAAVYELLLAPVAGSLRGISTIIFVPDRFLQSVPFAALFDARRGRYLIEDHAVAVSPSARLLDVLAKTQRSSAAQDILVMANPYTAREFPPLPAGEREGGAIGLLYRNRSVAIGRDATRNRFLREWRMSRVVHFSAHASPAPDRGQLATLVLARENAADYVHPSEIPGTSRWDDRVHVGGTVIDDPEDGAGRFFTLGPTPATRLVVLAACGTLAGGDEHLDRNQTLAHAFLAAGVPTVVGTLWPIEDEASWPFFVDFHRRVAAGASVGEALRRAQLNLLSSPDPHVSHPATWAGVTVLGVPWLAVNE